MDEIIMLAITSAMAKIKEPHKKLALSACLKKQAKTLRQEAEAEGLQEIETDQYKVIKTQKVIFETEAEISDHPYNFLVSEYAPESAPYYFLENPVTGVKTKITPAKPKAKIFWSVRFKSDEFNP